MKKILAILLSLVLSFSMLIGCESTEETSNIAPEGEKSDTITYGSANDYDRINPVTDEHGEIHKLIYSGLTKFAKDGKVIPDLAEKWEYDESKFAYTFHLKKDAKWQDGQPFTAEDVKFTIEAIKNPENASEIGTNFEDVKSIEVVDQNTVKIALSGPNAAILDYLTVGMIPKHLLEGKDLQKDKFNQNPIGTGPYMIDKWEMGQYIKLKANENYYGNKANIKNVIFKIIPDEKVRVMQLKSAEIDLAQIEPKNINAFEGEEGFKIYKEKTADYRGIMYNFKKDLFKNNKEVIQAINYAINRDEIVKGILDGYGYVAYSPIQAGQYYNDNIEKYSYNVEKAKQILADAGWKMGNDGVLEKNGQKLAFELCCFEGDPIRINMSNFSAQELKKIGIDVKVNVLTDMDWDNFDSFLIGWGSPFDPDDHTYKVFHTDAGCNYNMYSNPKVDEYLQKARDTFNVDERKKYYNEFQTELAIDSPYTFLAYIDAVFVARDNITGIESTVLGHHGVGFLWNINDWTIK